MPNNSSRRSNEQDRTKRYKTPQTRRKSSGRPRSSDTRQEKLIQIIKKEEK